MEGKKVFSLISVALLMYYIIQRFITLVKIVRIDGFFHHISIVMIIISFAFIIYANILTVMEDRLYLRKTLFLYAVILNVFSMIMSYINYDVAILSPASLRIMFSLFSLTIIYYSIDKEKWNTAYLFVVVLFLMVLLIFGRELQNNFQSSLSYILGLGGSLFMMMISSYIEVKEKLDDFRQS